MFSLMELKLIFVTHIAHKNMAYKNITSVPIFIECKNQSTIYICNMHGLTFEHKLLCISVSRDYVSVFTTVFSNLPTNSKSNYNFPRTLVSGCPHISANLCSRSGEIEIL